MALAKYEKIKSGDISFKDVIDWHLGSFEFREIEINDVVFPYHRDKPIVITLTGRKETIKSGFFGQQLEQVWKVQIFPPGITYSEDPRDAEDPYFKKAIVGEYPVERLWYFTVKSCVYGPDHNGEYYSEQIPYMGHV